MNFLLLVVSFSLAAGKEDKVYQKLEKSYTKDPEKGYVLAKQYRKKDNTLAAPYFFESQYFERKAGLVKKTADQALALGNAATNGASFEKKASDKILLRAQWETKKEILHDKIVACLTKLNEEHNSSKFKRLTDKSMGLFGDLSLEIEPMVEKEVVVEKKMEPAQPDAAVSAGNQSVAYLSMSKIDFSKKPTGKERIQSANQEEETKILEMINNERIRKKLKPLVLDSNLVFAARYHAADMATEDYFEHDSHNKTNGKLSTSMGAFERIAVFYSAFANTENIAAGNSTAEATYDQWYFSPGHNANMFNSSATKVGIGFIQNPSSSFGSYWVFCTGTD
ncbi:MAG: CAP domain-containing protein [Bacteroidota bacterium]